MYYAIQGTVYNDGRLYNVTKGKLIDGTLKPTNSYKLSFGLKWYIHIGIESMQMKKIFTLVCWIGMLQLAFAQKATLITTLSFEELTGGIIIIKAQLDQNKDSINFIFDTGSGGVSLDSNLASQLDWNILPSDKTVKGIAGIKNVPFSFKHQVHFKNLSLENLDFYINDYSLLTSVYGVRIDGIIGYSFLRRYIFDINYDRHEIAIYSPGEFNYKGGSFLKTYFYNLPVSNIFLKDAKKINPDFIFDIGAGLNLLISSQLEDSNQFMFKNNKRYQVQAEGIGGKKQMEITTIKRLQVGPYRFKNIPVHIFEDEFNVTNYPTMGGLLGNDILRRFNVVLNYPSQLIYITPNNHFYDAFDYAYTGLGIYLLDGLITVVDIVKGSPGDIAGLQSGDILFTFNKKLITNIQDLKNVLQNSIGKVQIIVIRKGVPIALKIKVKDIRR